MKSADQKRPLKVFLCHAHADRDPVCGLYTRLTQAINGLTSGQADASGQNPFKSVQIRLSVSESVEDI